VVTFAVCACGFLVLAHLYGTAEIGGRNFCVLDDDFMISQRYARNLARGDGLVFNPGDRVEGFSNPLTVLTVSYPLELLGVEGPRLGLYVWAFNAMLHALIVLLLLRRDDGTVDRNGIAAALIYLSLPHHTFFAHAGLEVYLQGLLLLALVIGLVRGGALFYAPMVLLPLTHPSGVPSWVGGGVLHLLRERTRWRRELLFLVAAAVPFAAYVAFRLAYYGQLVPNTYFLKVTGVTMPGLGLRYLWKGVEPIAPALALLVLGLLRPGRRGPSALTLAVLFAPYLLAVIRVGGDTIPWHRMVFVLVPALLYAAAERHRTLTPPWYSALLLAGVVAQLLLSAAQWPAADARARVLLGWERNRIVLGLAIHANTSREQTVALFGLGLAGYFADRPVIDMLGKTDAHVARTPAKLWRQVGHQKSDPAYVLGRRPEYVEMPYTVEEVADQRSLRQESRGRWGYFAELALDPSFQQGYVPVATRGERIPLWRRRDLPGRIWAGYDESGPVSARTR
jgi:arabinofuranosyltransferase